MIYTTNFAKSKKVNGVKVSIAQFTPKWFTGVEAKFFAPDIKNLNDYKNGVINRTQFTSQYMSQLSNLDIELVKLYFYNALLGNQLDIYLLCYEKSEDFCHRHILRAWLNKNGIYCQEVGEPNV